MKESFQSSLRSSIRFTGVHLVACAVAIFFFYAALPHANGQDLESELLAADVYQLNTEFDGLYVENTDWGSVDIMFMGSLEILYFNLSRDGEWIIQNLPVASSGGIGELQSLSIGFDLGIAEGTPVEFVTLALELTPEELVGAPLNDQPYLVTPQTVTIDSGHRRFAIQPQVAAGRVEIGGKPKECAVVGASITNQECGVRECVPAAVHNALDFLNYYHNLGIDPDLISIEALKTALAWQSSRGCKLPDKHRLNDSGWPKKKKEYLQSKNIPITTTVFGKRGIAHAETALQNGCVVEMNVPGHTVLVTAITRLGNGRFTIEVAHDTEQGRPGGTKFESMTYKKSSAGLSGVSWAKKVHSFVVECPNGG